MSPSGPNQGEQLGQWELFYKGELLVIPLYTNTDKLNNGIAPPYIRIRALCQKTFPHVDSDMIDASPPHSDDTEKIPKENCCDCPPRQNPPPIPTALPFPATE